MNQTLFAALQFVVALILLYCAIRFTWITFESPFNAATVGWLFGALILFSFPATFTYVGVDLLNSGMRISNGKLMVRNFGQKIGPYQNHQVSIADIKSIELRSASTSLKAPSNHPAPFVSLKSGGGFYIEPLGDRSKGGTNATLQNEIIQQLLTYIGLPVDQSLN